MPIEIRIKYLIVIGVTLPLLLLMTWIVQKTKVGKAMRATAQDRDASLLMGINVDKIISYVFALGGALAGAAGTMFVQVNGQTRYDAGFRLGLIAFTAAVLGGVGNLLGAVVGGVLIGVIQSLNDSGLGFFPGQKWTQTVLFGILIMMIIFRPAGCSVRISRRRFSHGLDHHPGHPGGRTLVGLYYGRKLSPPRAAARRGCDGSRVRPAAPVVHQGDRRLPPAVHDRPVRRLRPVRPRPQHRRWLRRVARPGIRRLLPRGGLRRSLVHVRLRGQRLQQRRDP